MIAVGDEFGVIRTVKRPNDSGWDGAVASGLFGQRDKAHGVSSLSTASVADHAIVMAARVNGTVTIHSQNTFTELGRLDVSGACGVVAALLTPAADKVIAACEDGRLDVQKLQLSDDMKLTAETCLSIDTRTALSCCATATSTCLAVGGQGKEITTWDLCSGKLVHQLKGPKPDAQTQLSEAPWTTCMDPVSGGRLLCGTAYHKVRLYDLAAQKRPVMQWSWLDARITAIAAHSSGNWAWIANGKGFIQALDFREKVLTGSLKGQIGGSVRSLKLASDQNLVCSVSLDKWLRVHDSRTRRMMCKIYLKAALTSCMWMPADSNDKHTAPPPPPIRSHARHRDQVDGAPAQKRVRSTA